MDLQEVGYEGIDWIRLAQDREMWRAIMNALINFRVQ
jgi:predicted nucleotidyltransferase